MNALQKTQLELLKNFLDTCDHLGLRYFLVCGSALGAVKYRGFIPWDDDVDIAMPRKDYEIFCARAQTLLPEYVFVQNFRTDPAFPYIYTKLRHSRTTCVEYSSRRLPIHHGVFIDIFPLDGYPTRKGQQMLLEFRKTLFRLQLLSAFDGSYSLKVRLLMALFRIFGVHKRTARIAARYEAMVAAFPADTATIWCNHGNWQGKLDYAPKDWFGRGCEALFEGISVMIPAEYDAYLTRKYGDWRAELPLSQQKSHHHFTSLNLEQAE